MKNNIYTYSFRIELYLKMWRRYTWVKQFVKFTEEIGELLHAASKHELKPTKENKKKLADEICDALIVIDQLQVKYDLYEEVGQRIEFKLNREQKRLKKIDFKSRIQKVKGYE
jgi:NTP pyrophosphatase (non-canonical NTP hydrolase)